MVDRQSPIDQKSLIIDSDIPSVTKRLRKATFGRRNHIKLQNVLENFVAPKEKSPQVEN